MIAGTLSSYDVVLEATMEENERVNLRRVQDASERLAKTIGATLEPLLAQTGQLTRQVEQMIANLPAAGTALVHERLSAQTRQLTRPVAQVEQMIARFSDVNTAVLRLAEVAHRQIAPVLEELHQSWETLLQDLPPKARRAVVGLGKLGWYFDLEMPIQVLGRMIPEEDDAGEVEKGLCEHFSRRLNSIEQSVNSRFPHRAHIISAAIAAHRRGEYVLSIPVLLTQADGICFDVAGQSFFRRKRSRPRTAAWVEKIVAERLRAELLRAALLEPLKHALPVNQNESERPDDFQGLNRHVVLHGESVDFGTKTNSLKAISLLNYLATVLPQDKEKAP